MNTTFSQETIEEYATSAEAKELPSGLDYTLGGRVGRTIPAKWWNGLFAKITKGLKQSRVDSESTFNEVQNAVTGAGLTLDNDDDTQLSQAIGITSENAIDEYLDEKGRNEIDLDTHTMSIF